MPDFRPALSREELAKRRAIRSTRVDLQPYIDYLLTVTEGGAGEIGILEGERKPTIKRRVTMAAGKAGKKVKYLRSSENELVFEVTPA